MFQSKQTMIRQSAMIFLAELEKKINTKKQRRRSVISVAFAVLGAYLHYG